MRLGAYNYLRLIGFDIGAGIISIFLLLITLGLASIIVIPAMFIAQAYILQQISRGIYQPLN